MTKLQNNVTTQQKRTFASYLTNGAVKNKVNQMISGKNGDRFISALISAVTINPNLADCDHGSILAAAMLGEALKLSPSPQLGQYFLVPYNDKNKGEVAQFQLGYKGYIQLAIRSGQYKKLNVLAIKEGELIKYDPLNEEIHVKLIEDDTERESTPTIGYYAMFEYTAGFRKTMYWSKEKMISHADKYSAAFSREAKKGRKPEYNKVSFADFEAKNIPSGTEWLYSSFWYQDFDGMAYKTMLRQLISKWGIMSIELQQAINNDMAAIMEDGQPVFVDNKQAIDLEPTLIPLDETPQEVIQPQEGDDPLSNFN